MHLCCLLGRIDVFEVFLQSCSGSSASKALIIEDKQFRTPIMCAIEAGASNIVLYLLSWERSAIFTRSEWSRNKIRNTGKGVHTNSSPSISRLKEMYKDKFFENATQKNILLRLLPDLDKRTTVKDLKQECEKRDLPTEVKNMLLKLLGEENNNL